MKPIYFDHNASTPCSAEVVEAMAPFYSEIYANPSSIHQSGQKARKAIEDARQVMARFINAQSAEEIIFTSGGTESNNLALKGVLDASPTRLKRFVSSSIEHSAVRSVLHQLASHGRIDYVACPVHPSGLVDLGAINDAMTPDTLLVSVMAANNEVGTVQPVAEIAKLCQQKNILFHTDAVQVAGKMNIDVQQWGVDLLSLSAHKFGGPKGVGLLYVRKGTRMEALINGGRQEKNRRGGTENVAAIVGMAKAAEKIFSDLTTHVTKLTQLRDLFETSILESISHTHRNGEAAQRVCNTTNICFEYTDNTEMLMALDLQGLACSNGSACHAGSPEASHVLLAMGLTQDKAHASLRFSLGISNTQDEVEQAVKIIQDTVKRLRQKHPLWRQSVKHHV